MIIVASLNLFIYGCDNSNKKTTGETKIQVPVQNTNDEVPDTTNSIGLDTHKKDTLKVKDSIKK